MFSNQDLRKLIFPLVIEQALVMMVGIVDTVMVSYVGEAAISGVALVDMINYLIIVVLSAIDTGGAVIVSQYLGRKDKKNAGRCASQLLLVTVLLSIAIMGICLVFHTMILELLFGAIDADVKKAAVTYFLITALSFPFLGIYNSSAAIFRSMQKTKITMYVSVLINVINIAGDAIGIFVLHAGVAGVAVPTLVSRMAGAVIMLAMSFNEKNQVSVKMREIFAWNKETVKKILRIAVPNGIENGLFALGKVLVTSIVALFGTYQIAANGVANGIDQIAILVVNAINLAVVTVVGQCSGAGEYDQAEKYTKKLMKISYIATGTLGLGVCLLLPVIHGFYIISEETWKLGCILVVMHNVMAFLLHPTSFNLSNSLRASGDVKITMYIGIGSMLVFRLGTAVFLGIVCNMGIIGVWIAMGMDWLARSVAFSIRYKSGKWKKIRVI
ncbi:MAG: hypothetical protein RHS_0858 [Robinsoniella sp. RHS]|uniref:MATE family efflux transporter n=1 Tax=Robinsoniella sp. RHS TaxID=1504536 RepID=UPI0006493BD3|nr:MAG: hypothetical protein RHS_0858 [Robinsoniella sp. RHS]